MARSRLGMLLGFVLIGAAVTALGLVQCSQIEGRPPVARLQVEPRYVPVNVESVVTLDGRRSCDEIDHPETCDKSEDGEGPPLTCPGGVSFRWELDYPFTPVGGDDALKLPRLEVRLTPDRPVTVTLTVTDCDRNSVTTSTQIGIELPYPAPDAGVPRDGG